LQALLGEDGVRRRFQTAVGDQTTNAANPDVNAHADFGVLVRAGGGSREFQRLGGVDLFRARRALAAAAAEFAWIDDAVFHQAVTDQRQPYQEDQDPSALFNLYGHVFSLCRFAPTRFHSIATTKCFSPLSAGSPRGRARP